MTDTISPKTAGAEPARAISPRGVLFVIHPFPAFMNALAGAIFYAIASGGMHPGAAAVFLSVLLIHAAIGATNDYRDVDLDRRTRPDKPLVSGDITPRGAMVVALVAGLAGCGLALAFGAGTLVVALAVLASGLAYDLWLKGTLWSWVPYGIAIPALPVWGFVAAGRFSPLILASFPLGTLIALALNLANTIPDLAGDTEYGIRGLAHRLGERRATQVVWACFAIALVLLALTPPVLGNDPAILFTGLGVALVLLVLLVLDEQFSPGPARFKRGWYLAAVLAVVLGGAWVASLPSG